MMIEAIELGKRFGDQWALVGLSFMVAPGEVVGVLGCNGAGKTTLLRLVAGFLAPSAGRLRVDGMDVTRANLAARNRMGYMPETAVLYPEMRVEEYLAFRGRLKGLAGTRLTERLTTVKTNCGLNDIARRIVGQLSLGHRRRVGLADALLAEPPLLILDEPTAGLDFKQTSATQALIRSIAGKQTILMAGNHVPFIEAVCNRVMVLQAEGLSPNGSSAGFRSPQQALVVVAELQAEPAAVQEALRTLPDIAEIGLDTRGEWLLVRLTCTNDRDPRPALSALTAARGWPLRELRYESAYHAFPQTECSEGLIHCRPHQKIAPMSAS